ncbi:ribokinase [Weizmannia acidilactici]|uniref:Ribokinase n=1 Tax=Weizmannia acidilactici TaxID=2607726 RepID=A0A5J4JMV0_9BACI|nr:ribokinase [Weizmannia acidilactici]GER70314.1 ribokinase [Weizmannia acidilactici]GER73558.1 ribokinase [Weizmannia acidilactici]
MVHITVIGSCSMDLVVTAERRPLAGETVIGNSFQTVPGGKGANQAVAAARLGAEVTMVGRVGDDVYGEKILENLRKNGVNIQFMMPVANCASGTAHITLAEGDNSIIFVKGANDFVTPEYLEKTEEAVTSTDIVLIQQEIPVKTVEYAAELCSRHRIPLLLNPAPARSVSGELIGRAAFITPNEHECDVLFNGMPRSEALKQFPNKLIITEGKNGARFFNGSREIVVPAFPVEAVDTTGAGDTFNAAFAVAVAEGKKMEEALRFANRAASLSVTKFGAQGGMPFREELEKHR